MNHGGIPKYHKDFYATDKKRSKAFAIPLYTDTLEGRALRDKIIEFDAYFDSTDFKKNVMGWSDKTMRNYKYQKIIRHAKQLEDDDEEDDEDQLKKKKDAREKLLRYGPDPDKIKPDFTLGYETDACEVKILVNNDGVLNPVETLTLDDAAAFVNFRCEAVFLITPNKVYVKKNAEANETYKTWGVTWKVICVDCIPASANEPIKLADNPFLSDDEDDEDDDVHVKGKDARTVVATKLAPDVDEDEIDETEDPVEEDEDEEEENDQEDEEDEDEVDVDDVELEEDQEEDEAEEDVEEDQDDEVEEVEDVEDDQDDEVEDDQDEDVEEDGDEVEDVEEDQEEQEEQEEDEEEVEVIEVPKVKKTKKTTKKVTKKVIEPEPEEDEEVIVPKKAPKKIIKKEEAPKKTKVGRKAKIVEEVPDEEDVITPVIKKKTKKVTVKSKAK